MGTGELRMLCFEREVEQCLYERNKGYWAGRGVAVCGVWRERLFKVSVVALELTHARTASSYTCIQNNLYAYIRHPRHPFTNSTDSSIRARVRFNLG